MDIPTEVLEEISFAYSYLLRLIKIANQQKSEPFHKTITDLESCHILKKYTEQVCDFQNDFPVHKFFNVVAAFLEKIAQTYFADEESKLLLDIVKSLRVFAKEKDLWKQRKIKEATITLVMEGNFNMMMKRNKNDLEKVKGKLADMLKSQFRDDTIEVVDASAGVCVTFATHKFALFKKFFANNPKPFLEALKIHEIDIHSYCRIKPVSTYALQWITGSINNEEKTIEGRNNNNLQDPVTTYEWGKAQSFADIHFIEGSTPETWSWKPQLIAYVKQLPGYHHICLSVDLDNVERPYIAEVSIKATHFEEAKMQLQSDKPFQIKLRKVSDNIQYNLERKHTELDQR